jgi:hypothetical protein
MEASPLFFLLSKIGNKVEFRSGIQIGNLNLAERLDP